MLYVLSLLVIIAFLYVAFIILKKVIREVKKEIRKYKESSESEKGLKELVFFVVAFPIVIYLLDRFNFFSYLKITDSITINYDWLSFIGTYAGTIISALFLIYITRMDRKDNNENVRESQRPYLYTNFEAKNTKEIQNIEDEVFMISNSYDDGVKIPILKITNAGESASIIDVAKSYVQIKYSIVEEIEQGKSDIKEYSKKLNFDVVIKRLAIPSKKTFYICFDDEDFNIQELMENIEITESYIEYEDLFGKNYVDYIKSENGKIKVVEDNELKSKD